MCAYLVKFMIHILIIQHVPLSVEDEASTCASGIPGSRPALEPRGIVASTGVKLPPLERRTLITKKSY